MASGARWRAAAGNTGLAGLDTVQPWQWRSRSARRLGVASLRRRLGRRLGRALDGVFRFGGLLGLLVGCGRGLFLGLWRRRGFGMGALGRFAALGLGVRVLAGIRG